MIARFAARTGGRSSVRSPLGRDRVIEPLTSQIVMLPPCRPHIRNPGIRRTPKPLAVLRIVNVRDGHGPRRRRHGRLHRTGWDAQAAPDRVVNARIVGTLNRRAEAAKMCGQRFDRPYIGRMLEAIRVDDGATSVSEHDIGRRASAELVEHGVAFSSPAEPRATIGTANHRAYLRSRQPRVQAADDFGARAIPSSWANIRKFMKTRDENPGT